MKQPQRFYNLIFPIWIIWLFPPIILFCGVGNFLIDAVAILIGMKCLNIIRPAWKKSLHIILSAWLCGFAADFVGALYLLAVNILIRKLPFDTYSVTSAIEYNPFGNPVAFLVVLSAMAVAGFCIYHFDRRAAFQDLEANDAQRHKLSLVMAIATAPYLFFLPMTLFY